MNASSLVPYNCFRTSNPYFAVLTCYLPTFYHLPPNHRRLPPPQPASLNSIKSAQPNEISTRNFIARPFRPRPTARPPTRTTLALANLELLSCSYAYHVSSIPLHDPLAARNTFLLEPTVTLINAEVLIIRNYASSIAHAFQSHFTGTRTPL